MANRVRQLADQIPGRIGHPATYRLRNGQEALQVEHRAVEEQRGRRVHLQGPHP